MTEARKHTHDEEEHGQRAEARELDWPAAPAVDEEEGDPVAGDEACKGEDEVSERRVHERVIHGPATRYVLVGRAEANGLHDNRGVEAEAVERKLPPIMSNSDARGYRQEPTSSANHE